MEGYEDGKTKGAGHIYILKMESPHTHSLGERRDPKLESFPTWMGHGQLDLNFSGIANALEAVRQERTEDESWGSIRLSIHLRMGDSSQLLT